MLKNSSGSGVWGLGFVGFFAKWAQSSKWTLFSIILHWFCTRNVKTFRFAFLIVAQIWHELHSDNLIQLLFIILEILNADVM